MGSAEGGEEGEGFEVAEGVGETEEVEEGAWGVAADAVGAALVAGGAVTSARGSTISACTVGGTCCMAWRIAGEALAVRVEQRASERAVVAAMRPLMRGSVRGLCAGVGMKGGASMGDGVADSTYCSAGSVSGGSGAPVEPFMRGGASTAEACERETNGLRMEEMGSMRALLHFHA